MFSETHIELEPGYQYEGNKTGDGCLIGASIGMIAGLAVRFIGEFAGWW